MAEASFQFLAVHLAISIPVLLLAVLLWRREVAVVSGYFCWGLLAGVLAFWLNTRLALGESAQAVTLSLAPMVEEALKGLPLLLLLRRDRLGRSPRLAVVCGMATGLAFSVQEGLFYFAESSRELVDIFTLAVRMSTTSLMHGMTTCFFAIGLVRLHRHREVLDAVVIGLFAIVASLHALFNLLLQTWLAPVTLIMPWAMFLACWAVLRRLEGAAPDCLQPSARLTRS